MKESYKIEIQVGKDTMKELSNAIKMVSDYGNPDKAFILQVFDDGQAMGLALCHKDAEALSDAMLPYWKAAKDLRDCQ